MLKRFGIGDYHMEFDTETGHMRRWGATEADDPDMCPAGPELADIEISTICHGVPPAAGQAPRPCPWCYKSNTGCGENMSLATFTHILNLFPHTLTQIAFGLGDIDANPDLWAILQLCRDRDIVPNLTVNGAITAEHAQKLAKLCGAVAVSHYDNDDLCFNAVQMLAEAGLQQVNIHKLVANETLQSCHSLIKKAAADPRLAKLKAIVLLQLKQKGERNKLTPVARDGEYTLLLARAIARGVGVGMDSCSAPRALRAFAGDGANAREARNHIEPCESTLFSIYVDVRGRVWPCSFCEEVPGHEPIDLTKVQDFHDEVWYAPQIKEWRKRLLSSTSGCTKCALQKRGCRACPVYDITPCLKEQR